MLSYRHAFHAGNFADVHKHALLVMVLRALARKETPFACIDTHAGGGLYDLESAAGRKLGEYRRGVLRLWGRDDLPAPVADYFEQVRSLNDNRIVNYPGSPLLVRRLLRDGDRALLMELHPAEAERLAHRFARDRQVAVNAVDGLARLPLLVPPRQRRGLVLIDPSYEVKQEYQQVADALIAAHRRWPGGIYMIWYPLLPEARHHHLRDALKASGIRKILDSTLEIAPARGYGGMYGSGVLLLNPPWDLPGQWAPAGEWLAGVLGKEGARATTEWLVPE